MLLQGMPLREAALRRRAGLVDCRGRGGYFWTVYRCAGLLLERGRRLILGEVPLREAA